MKKSLFYAILCLIILALCILSSCKDDNVDDSEKTIPVMSVSLSKSTLIITVGESETLTPSISPETATNTEVSWVSSATNIAIVNKNGKIEAIAPGTAKITVTTVDGNKTADCIVTVSEKTFPVTGVSLDKTTATLRVGRVETLITTITPDNATNKALTWSSDATDVATVDNHGSVTAIAPGTATISVITTDGGKTANCIISVPVIEPEGVVISGLMWASRNVGKSGEFVTNPEDLGDFYDFEEAQKVCPKGWRTPTKEEQTNLSQPNGTPVSLFGVKGFQFGLNNQTIFIPVTTNSSSGTGYYWSNTIRIDQPTSAYGLYIYRGSDNNYATPGVETTLTSKNSVRCVKGNLIIEPEPDQDGISIRGLTWATHNVGVNGKFTKSFVDYGGLYTYDEAQKACPDGWRTPTREEFENLSVSANNAEVVNNVPGRRFHDGSNSIFLPGSELLPNDYGYYWSSTSYNGSVGYILFFYYYGIRTNDIQSFTKKCYVRCVK